ncbi:MAG: hypothetical protein M3Y13_02280, partial [Armatimonadota bacterium]|nr:hypothetical protein [Armatimonadota bacterium]
MTLQTNNLLLSAPSTQIHSLWSPAAASRLTTNFGTGETGGFVPSAAYQCGRNVTKNDPAPPIAFAVSHS